MAFTNAPYDTAPSFLEWCKKYLPDGNQNGASGWVCKNAFRGEKKASLSLTDKGPGLWFDHGTGEGGKIKFFAYENGISEVWAGAEPWDEHGDKDFLRKSRELDPAMKRRIEEALEADRRKKIEDRKAALEIWEEAIPATKNHPYVSRKRIFPDGLRMVTKPRKAPLLPQWTLIVPCRNLDGELTGVERISHNGESIGTLGKRPFIGSKEGGCYVPGDGRITVDRPVIVVEGAATGHSMHEITGGSACVAGCFSLGMAGSFIGALRERYGVFFTSIFAVDVCDYENPNNRSALAKVEKAGSMTIRLPADRERGHDWNDEVVHYGLDAARQSFIASLMAGSRAG